MSHDLCFVSATDLARLIRERAVTCQAVMRAHLDQIERVNPKVNAIVTLLPDQAVQGAREADRRLALGERIGPLHGLPVAHKDLLVTKGIRTTFGSPIYRDFVPDTDAVIVERLRARWRHHHRQDQHPGVRRRLADLQRGVRRHPQSVGRLEDLRRQQRRRGGRARLRHGAARGRHPTWAARCATRRASATSSACVPSAGRVPAWPSFNAWYPLSVLGPMGRTVEDVALLLSVLAGPDPRAPISITEPGSVFAGPLERDFRGLRVAWSKDLGGLPVDARVSQALEPGARSWRRWESTWSTPRLT